MMEKMTMTLTGYPRSNIDLFSDDILVDPYPTFKTLRDAGPAVYLTCYDMWFVGRYDIVRSVLSDWKGFSSASGVGMTDGFNGSMAKALICLDPPAHTPQRGLFMDRLSPAALRPVRDTIDAQARKLVADLLARDSFDAVEDLAHDLPVNVIMDLVGWDHGVRDQLIPMAVAFFNTAGPANARSDAAWPVIGEMFELVTKAAQQGALKEGSFGDHMVKAHQAGALSLEEVVGLLFGYIVAAFDTTINGISSAAIYLARHPDQWQILRADPELATRAFNEVIRLESPIQYFTRVATADVDLGEGVVIPAGARLLVSYGAANRDERHFDDPDTFDILRAKQDHLAFGAGRHACAGQNLARLEGQAVLKALATGARTITLLNEPNVALINAGRGFSCARIALG